MGVTVAVGDGEGVRVGPRASGAEQAETTKHRPVRAQARRAAWRDMSAIIREALSHVNEALLGTAESAHLSVFGHM